MKSTGATIRKIVVELYHAALIESDREDGKGDCVGGGRTGTDAIGGSTHTLVAHRKTQRGERAGEGGREREILGEEETGAAEAA